MGTNKMTTFLEVTFQREETGIKMFLKDEYLVYQWLHLLYGKAELGGGDQGLLGAQEEIREDVLILSMAFTQ